MKVISGINYRNTVIFKMSDMNYYVEINGITIQCSTFIDAMNAVDAALS